MNERLIQLAVVIAVPTMACFGYYTLAALPPQRSAWAIPAVLAYPLLLIGVLGLSSVLRSGPRSRKRIAFWLLFTAAPAAVLAWLRW